MRAIRAGKLRGLRRMADAQGRFQMTRVDQRPPISNPIAAAPSKPAPWEEMDRLCGRPWVMLSAGAGMAEFRAVLEHAGEAGASGNLAGRAIRSEALKLYPDWAKIGAELRGRGVGHMREINALTDAHAAPFWQTPGGVKLAGDVAGFARTHGDPSERGRPREQA